MQLVIRTRHYRARRASGIEAALRTSTLMRRSVSSAVALLMLLACALIPLRASAVNLGFLGNSPISMFQPADVDLMRKNAQEVLDSAQPNAKQAWSNPKTGASGFAQVTGTFTMADGTPCKRLRIFNKAGGLENVGVYPVCKYTGRGWVINADAQAPK
jgi:hypothetical protein